MFFNFSARPKRRKRNTISSFSIRLRSPRRRADLHDALRGYRELHVRAFKLLSRDGILATFSCSHHVSETLSRKQSPMHSSMRIVPRAGCGASSRPSIIPCCRPCPRQNISRACFWR